MRGDSRGRTSIEAPHNEQRLEATSRLLEQDIQKDIQTLTHTQAHTDTHRYTQTHRNTQTLRCTQTHTQAKGHTHTGLKWNNGLRGCDGQLPGRRHEEVHRSTDKYTNIQRQT